MKRLAAVLIALALLAAPAAAEDYWAGVRAYAAGDHAAALRELLPLAERGNAYAQHYVALILALGVAVPPNPGESNRWLHRSAEQGHAASQHLLGVKYASGVDVARDDVLAWFWLDLAAAQGLAISFEARDRLARRMTAAQVAQARRLAAAWMDRPWPALDSLLAADPAPDSGPAPATPAAGAAMPLPLVPDKLAGAADDTVWRVHLASLTSEADARKESERLQHANPELLGGLAFEVEKAALPQGTYYRLLGEPFADRATARALCARLMARNQYCIVVGR
jgi:cell division septation protein DedD